MLFVRRQPLDTLADLQAALANAIKLELATIPPYLTALYTIRPGHNAAAGAIVRSVAIEEMLHLSLVCNILNAVGGCPDLPASVPVYPSPLPMGIGSEPGQIFIVPLQKLSRATITDIFMVIEEPEQPLVFNKAQLATAEPEYHTIGEFYAAVAELISQLGPAVFTGNEKRQVTGWIGTNWLHAVADPPSAQAAIELIVEQGEGTATSPADGPDELAHYYRFEQIQRGHTLTPDPSAPNGYQWGKPLIPLDERGVWPMVDNPGQVPLPPGSQLAWQSDLFDRTFSTLIDGLQQAFDGRPDLLGNAIGQMYALRLQAQRLVALPIPGMAANAGPRFRYLTAEPG